MQVMKFHRCQDRRTDRAMRFPPAKKLVMRFPPIILEAMRFPPQKILISRRSRARVSQRPILSRVPMSIASFATGRIASRSAPHSWPFRQTKGRRCVATTTYVSDVFVRVTWHARARREAGASSAASRITAPSTVPWRRLPRGHQTRRHSR